MTAKQKLHAQVDRLTEVEAVDAQLVVRRVADDVDEWGSLSAFVEALAVDTLRSLDEEERAAGFGPW